MIVKTLLDKTGQTSTVDGETFIIHMPKSNRGIVMVQGANYNSISAVTFKIQGRLSSDMTFVDIANGSINQNANGTTAVEDIQLYPEMRAIVSTLTGTSGDLLVQLGC
jgi:hypothetical protein